MLERFVAHSLFVHKTYKNLIHNRLLAVVIGWNIFGCYGSTLVLCSIGSVVWPDMYVLLSHTNCVEVLSSYTIKI